MNEKILTGRIDTREPEVMAGLTAVSIGVEAGKLLWKKFVKKEKGEDRKKGEVVGSFARGALKNYRQMEELADVTNDAKLREKRRLVERIIDLVDDEEDKETLRGKFGDYEKKWERESREEKEDRETRDKVAKMLKNLLNK